MVESEGPSWNRRYCTFNANTPMHLNFMRATYYLSILLFMSLEQLFQIIHRYREQNIARGLTMYQFWEIMNNDYKINYTSISTKILIKKILEKGNSIICWTWHWVLPKLDIWIGVPMQIESCYDMLRTLPQKENKNRFFVVSLNINVMKGIHGSKTECNWSWKCTKLS